MYALASLLLLIIAIFQFRRKAKYDGIVFLVAAIGLFVLGGVAYVHEHPDVMAKLHAASSN